MRLLSGRGLVGFRPLTACAAIVLMCFNNLPVNYDPPTRTHIRLREKVGSQW